MKMKKHILFIVYLLLCAKFIFAAKTTFNNSMTNMNGSLRIIIKKPTPVLMYQASTNFINLSGVFYSSNKVSSIRWQKTHSESGDCSYDSKSNHWYKNHLVISEGTNIITVTITDVDSNIASDYIMVLYNTFGASDTNPPEVYVTAPTDGISTNSKIIKVYGTAYDNSGYVAVTVNDSLAGSNVWNRIIQLNLGSNVINITAYDISTNTSTKLLHIIFYDDIDNNPPIITVIAPNDWTETTESNVLVYGTAKDECSNIVVMVNGSIAGSNNWAKNVALTLGTNIINIVATDAHLNSSTNTIHVIRINDKLAITTTSEDLIGVTGETYIKKLETNQDDDDTDLWTIRGLPEESGLIFLETGVIQGVPTSEGEFSIVAEVTDSLSGESATTNLTITIQQQPSDVIILNNQTVDGVAGQPYSALIQLAGNNPNDNWRFSALDGMPLGVSLSTDGYISGVPSNVGNYEINIIVSNNNVAQTGALMSKKFLTNKIFFNVINNSADSIQSFEVKKSTIKIDRNKENNDKITTVFSFLAPENNFILTNYNWSINLANYPIPLNITKTFKNKKIKFLNKQDDNSKLLIKGKAVINKSDHIKVTIRVKNAKCASAFDVNDGENIPNIKYMPLQLNIDAHSGHLILPMSGKEKAKVILKLRK